MPTSDPADPHEMAWGLPTHSLRYSTPLGYLDEVTVGHDIAGNTGEEPACLTPAVPISVGHSRQVWIIGIVAATGVVVVITLGFLLLSPQKATAPPLIPITAVTTSSVVPTSTTSQVPLPAETVTETVTATYIPVPTVTSTATNVPAPTVTSSTGAPTSTTASNPNDIWDTCRQMHSRHWCNEHR